MKVKEIFGKDYTEFNAQDPFNDNWVEGYICRQHGDKYGSLLINKVNGDKKPQLIYCTPKIDYPFDRNGNWHFPKAKSIERYEKLDGTNIFNYRYYDARGNVYVSYKTRLLPFVGDSKFGPFQQMLKELLKANPEIGRLALKLNLNLSWELWGARNPHLVLYDTPLSLSLLFARNGQKIIPPSALHIDASFCVPLRGLVDRDYIWRYEQAQKELEGGLKEVDGDNYRGQEGEVWYLLTEDGLWHQYKCKPETIEAIHWAAGGIGKNIIRATCQNAFENWDRPTVENIVSLLLEEFDLHKVEKAHYAIQKYLGEEIEQQEFREKVLEEYYTLGISLLEDKVTVMRALSNKFPKDKMGRVYNAVWAMVAS